MKANTTVSLEGGLLEAVREEARRNGLSLSAQIEGWVKQRLSFAADSATSAEVSAPSTSPARSKPTRHPHP